MKKYGKLIDGQIQHAPSKIEEDGMWIIPPSEQQLIALGYKELITSPPPTAPEGYYYEFSGWEETETQIIQVWTLHEIPIPEQTAAEYLWEVLMGII
jgi:hypothetical protein